MASANFGGVGSLIKLGPRKKRILGTPTDSCIIVFRNQ